MNTYEQSVREFAHKIWESEGKPIGHECRHWEMACKLAEGLQNNSGLSNGQVLSIITPGEPFNPGSPEIDPAPDVPVNPISPTEPPAHTPTPTPVQPTDPVPGNPAQPIQPYSSKKSKTGMPAQC
jgi:Protein of unknown function (DUF2934)